MKHFGLIDKDGAFRYLCTGKHIGNWMCFAGDVKKVECKKCLKKLNEHCRKLHRILSDDGEFDVLIKLAKEKIKANEDYIDGLTL